MSCINYKNMNFVKNENQLLNMGQRYCRTLPREIQFNDTLQYVDINVNNMKRHIFVPQIQPQVQVVGPLYGSNQLPSKPNLTLMPVLPQIRTNVERLSNCYISKEAGSSSNTSVGGSSRVLDTDNLAPPQKLIPVSADHNAVKKRDSINAKPEQNSNNESNTSNNLNFKVFGSTENERMFIFTGTVERVIKWNKIFQNHFCYFEVIASMISLQEGSVRTQKIMLLRDRKGPVLQVVYYVTTHIDIEDFHVGQILRCVGKMTAQNILNAISIRTASQEEIETLQRLCLVCDHAVSHFLSV